MISKFSVRKPYTVLVAVVLVIVLGAVSLLKMTTDLLPDMSFQYALIITTDVGASPESIETGVTAPIEAAMATTSNIKNITSTSYNSYSMVVCEYEQSANMDSVVIEIQQKLDQLSGSFADSVGTPMIMQINPDMLPIMISAVDVDGMDQLQIADYVNNEIIPSLESVEGVASVSASGALTQTVEITLDDEKINELNEKLSKSINEKMAEAEKELKDGKKQAEEGKAALEDGKKELIEKTSSASNEIENNRIKLVNTKAQLEAQFQELDKTYSSMDTMIGTMNTTYAGAIQLEGAINQLETGIEKINEARKAAFTPAYDLGRIEYANTILAGLASSPVPIPGLPTGPIVDTAGAEALFYFIANAGIPNVSEGVYQGAEFAGVTAGNVAADAAEKMAIDQVNIMMAESGTQFSSLADMQDQVVTLKYTLSDINSMLIGQSANFSQLGVSVTSYNDIPQLVNAMVDSKAMMADGMEQISAGIGQVDEGMLQLNDAAAQLSEGQLSGMLQMANGYTDLVNALMQIEAGQAKLDEARDAALEQADLTKVLNVQMISQLLVAQNFDMPAGYAYDNNGKEFLVHVGEAVNTFSDLRDLVLMDFGTEEVGIIKLRDIADVKLIDNAGETYAIINGNPGVMLTMEKQSGYSTGDVTDRLLKKFESLEKIDESLHFSVLMNQGVYIDMVVSSVFQNMIFGAILAIFVLLLFLKDIKPTVIIACSIPLSVITAVVLMYFSNITLNIISMSGLVLGIGMLVDNSIVVIENIYRLRGEGLSIKKAAVEGASQVSGAIIASTLTTVSVYAPIIFTEGITRQLFVDLALTIAYTLVASLVVALTLVPAMSSAMLTSTKEIKHPWFDKAMDWYGGVLELALNHKLIVFAISIVLLVASAALSLSRGLNFMEMEMEADQLSASISANEDQNLEFDELVALSDKFIERVSDIEGIDTVGAMMGSSSGFSMLNTSSSSVSVYILLDPDMDLSLKDIADQIYEKTADLDCKIEVETNMMDMSAMMASGLSVEIKGRDIDVLQDLTAKVADIVKNTEGTINVNDGLDNQSDEFEIIVDKEKAAEYGFTVAQVFQLVYGEMASSTSATTLVTDLKDYEVFVQTEVQSDAKLKDIENLTFEHTNDDGDVEDIPITEIAKLQKSTTLSTIRRSAQTRYLTVSAEIDEDHNVTLVGNAIQAEIDKLDIPEGYTVEMAGEDENIKDAMQQMVLMMILAVIFIYLIMVAQFQSLLNPFIIMFSIPLAFTGGFLAIYISGETLNVISMLGFIMLAGLIVNNGIVLIDYITQARQEGKSKREAIIESGKIRMRPILMTAMTTILAMSTSAFSGQDGAEMMAPMAVSIIGGLVYGTILTLLVIPCLYDVFNKEKSMVEEEL